MFHSDFTRYQDTLQFFSASYEKPPGPVRYPGLKIFAPLHYASKIFSDSAHAVSWEELKAELIERAAQ